MTFARLALAILVTASLSSVAQAGRLRGGPASAKRKADVRAELARAERNIVERSAAMGRRNPTTMTHVLRVLGIGSWPARATRIERTARKEAARGRAQLDRGATDDAEGTLVRLQNLEDHGTVRFRWP